MDVTFIDTFLSYARDVIPWFLIGVGVAYIVERRVSAKDVSAMLGKGGPTRVLTAFGLGMVSPLSIMPQLPVSGTLVRMGASPMLLLGFLAAERSYDFQSFPIIASFFGTRFAALNIIAIYVSLLAAFLVLRRSRVTFRATKDIGHKNGFLRRQLRLFVVVVLGIAAGAFARTVIPEALFAELARTDIGGLVTGAVSGFALYFGTILGNYPVAKAFADLGMSATGVFTFLTVSPLFNGVVIGLFVSAAHWKDVMRFFATYTLVALALSAGIGMVLL